MKLLLTGSNGFLGQVILKKLSMHYYVSTLSRYNCDIPCNLVNDIPKLNYFDIVVHAAGKAHLIPKSDEENAAFFDVNVKGTQNLLDGLELIGRFPYFFIFISTVAVYGLDHGENINENAPLLAKDSYGLSKIKAEKKILDWCQKNNVVCSILRLPLVVGNNPPGNLRAMIKGIKHGYYFNIDDGKAKKSLVLVEDVADFISIVAPKGGIYNLTDGVNPTFKEISSAISNYKILSLPLFLAVIIAKIGDLIGSLSPLNTLKLKKIISSLTFDDSKAKSIGWKPKSVLEYLKQNDF